MNNLIELERRYCAENYLPLPVVLTRGEGCYVWDTEGRRYLDMMSAYSAASHGHSHPRLVRALTEQAGRLSIVSRAFYNDKLGAFLEKVCQLSGLDQALPMNTGAEAIETAIKAARKWAYEVKGVRADHAEIIACNGNFHGRTLATVAMSSEPQYKRNFGPFPPGFRLIEFGDAEALDAAIGPDTAAFLVEPIQGEGGIVVPPSGYLKACEKICREKNVLLIFDEIQTGLGRTGHFLACEEDGAFPDAVTLGKALGGGLYPVSLFLARREIMERFGPGDHGSTFGGNSLAAAVALEALNVLHDEKLIENSARQGRYLMDGLHKIQSPLIADIRGRGLLVGLEIDPAIIDARTICERLMRHGLLTKETHNTVIRLTPPLIANQADIDFALDAISATLIDLASSI